ncbi:protein DMP10-like [Phragmites australis]|uniref:protein DMP10-like n=1 Tax=Phragmites australis TaxID=29695 RepID=UPI002D78608F|nr:protein DMP10-like [Phragmites australis]
MASPPPATVIHMSSHTNGEPTTSPTIGTAPQTPNAADDSIAIPMAASPGTVTDKVMSSASNLAQLLPTGTVLAYQALSPSFTNHGTCLPSNKWLTAAMVTILAALSLFFSFTDSIVGRDRKLYYGVATLHGFNVFNFSGEEEKREWALGELQRLRLRPLDYVHAFFTAVVFLTVAFSDAGLQRCFFPSASPNTKELLTNLPLGMAFLSSFLFMIFPSKRKGIGYNDTTPYQKAA